MNLVARPNLPPTKPSAPEHNLPAPRPASVRVSDEQCTKILLTIALVAIGVFCFGAIVSPGRTVRSEQVVKATPASDIKQCKRSAVAGNLDQAFELANKYVNGEGVAVDLERAGYWYGKAAEYSLQKSLKSISDVGLVACWTQEIRDQLKAEQGEPCSASNALISLEE